MTSNFLKVFQSKSMCKVDLKYLKYTFKTDFG